MQYFKIQKNALVLTMLLSVFVISVAFAIDNPDTPDYISDFNSRSKSYEKAVKAPGLKNRALISAYYDYQLFLDKELNRAYKLLRAKLSKEQQLDLKKSQQKWLKYRDTEFEFITNNWTRANFGSSAYLSRGEYKNTIIRNRVQILLSYALNY